MKSKRRCSKSPTRDDPQTASIVAALCDETEAVQLADQLDQARALLATTVSAVRDAIVKIDLNGRIQYLNRAACEISGQPFEKLIGKSFLTQFPFAGLDDKAEKALSGRGDHLEASRCDLSVSLMASGSEVRDINLTLQPLQQAPGKKAGYVAVMRDVTERSQAEATLTRTEQLLHAALGHAPVGLSVSDREGRISFVNDKFAEIFGIAPSGIIGKAVEELFSQRDADDGNAIKLLPGLPDELRDDIDDKIIKHPFSSRRRLRVSSRCIRNGAGDVVYGIVQVQDVTEEVQRFKALHDANELAQVTIRAASEGIVRIDVHGVITFCNSAAAQFVGSRPEALVGRTFGEVFKFLIGSREIEIEDPVAIVLRRGDPITMNSTLKLKGSEGSSPRVTLSIAPTLDVNKAVAGAVALVRDASLTAMLSDRLAQQALTDDLTGLANRRAFEARLEERGRGGADSVWPDHVLYINLDHFKIVNNVCGREAGNRLLRDAAEIFLSCVRDSDLVARIGGDEFGIIMHGTSDAGAMAAADKINAALSEYRFKFEGETFQIGASIGLAKARPDISASELINEADTACLAAKRPPRGRVHLLRADDDAISGVQTFHNWHHRILEGIEDRLFRISLECIVSNERKVIGYKGLLRLADDEGSFEPEAFIEVARRHNLYSQLDRFALNQTVALMQAPPETDGAGDPCISININEASIADPVFRSWLETFLDEHENLARRLWLELPGSEQMKWTNAEIAFLQAVRARGVRVYLDDFGTGYNSFDLLKKVEVDGLKLDGSAVRHVISSPIDQALVGAALSVARNLDLDVIAEGVDDEATLKFLLSLGLKKFQGGLFCRAGDAETPPAADPGIERETTQRQ